VFYAANPIDANQHVTQLAAGVEGPASLAEVKQYLMLRLGDRAGVQVHDATLEGMLPDGPTDCSDAHSPGLMPI
jgi:hypothetical protein